MKILNMINALVRFENILCIYRNSSYLKERGLLLVKLHIFVNTCLVFCANGYVMQQNLESTPKDRYKNISYILNYCDIFFTTADTYAAVFLSCYNSNEFKEFVSNIMAVHKLYKNDTKFHHITKKQHRSCLIELAVFATGFAIIMAGFAITSEDIFESLGEAFLFVVDISLQLRYFYENMVFYELIKVIVAPLMFLNCSIDMMVEKIKAGYGEEYDDVLWEVRRELEKWGAASQHLVTASKRLCSCFGVQIALSFFSSTIYYIMFLYQGISNVVTKEPPPPGFDCGSVAYSLTLFVAMMFLLVRAGQRATRHADRLHKNLVVLHNLLAGIPGEEASACARAAAGLARRLRAAPLRLRLLPSLTLQMALLAGILAIIANYTIVLLQFNHVV